MGEPDILSPLWLECLCVQFAFVAEEVIVVEEAFVAEQVDCSNTWLTDSDDFLIF